MIHDLSFYIPSSFTCTQNCRWCELCISATSQCFKKDFKITFCRWSLGREVLLCVQSCKSLRELEQCSTVLMRKPIRSTACHKIHLILFLCLPISFLVLPNVHSGLAFPSVMQLNHSGWLKPAFLHWDFLLEK